MAFPSAANSTISTRARCRPRSRRGGVFELLLPPVGIPDPGAHDRETPEQPVDVAVDRIRQHEGGEAAAERCHQRKLGPWHLELRAAFLLPGTEFRVQ